MPLSMKHDHYQHNFCFRYLVIAILNYCHGPCQVRAWYNGQHKIQLSYLLNPNFIALFALHVLCNIKTAMKNIPTNPFLITGYQGPDYFCDRENA